MHLLRGKPSPAMVVAVCALAFAMVGTAVAGTDGLNEKITKSKVKSIAKKQINKAAPGLSVANAVKADKATKADNAENLGGSPANTYQKKGLAPFVPITAFLNNWGRFAATFSQPGYWVDEDGVVNLQGGLSGGTSPAAFALPPGVRPVTFRSFVIRCSGGAGAGVVEINPTSGNVTIFSQGTSSCPGFAFLDGLTFRPDN